MTLDEKIRLLEDATKAYDEGHPFMSDKEWDDLYFELKSEGVLAADKITYDAVNELTKVEHNHPMLSLAKTKDMDEIKVFVANKTCCVMPKYDGLSCSLWYKDGSLYRAETRGNGIIGEDITHNVKTIKSIPQKINIEGEFIVDGEILCRGYDFNEKWAEEYSNSRNFAAGSIRLLDANECAKRPLEFWAWDIIKGDDNEYLLTEKIQFLLSLGFLTNFKRYIYKEDSDSIEDIIEHIKSWSKISTIPIDGVVFKVDDCTEYAKMGMTAHHPRGALAYKFYDETYSTVLRNIEWTMGRFGTLTPVALFDPVNIDGAEVERANLHNLTIMDEILGPHPYNGQKIEVYRANMIIPQIYSAEKENHLVEQDDYIVKPIKCPYCGQELVEETLNDSTVLKCINTKCESNIIERINHYMGKKGLDIKGFSRATIEKLINLGWLTCFEDIYSLKDHEKEWIQQSGFGEVSVKKLLAAIEKSKKDCKWTTYLSALGIPLIGQNVSKELGRYFDSYQQFRDAIEHKYNFMSLPNFGESKYEAIMSFDYTEADKISSLLTFSEKNDKIYTETKGNKFNDLTFVITGKLINFKNRNELKQKIEDNGGKVADRINKDVSYLINNDINSTSAKNKKAKELGIPIISEKDFLKKFDL